MQQQLAAAKARLATKLPRPPMSDLIDHIDHMVKVAGVDHVGLGSDFDGIDCSPQGIDSVADLPKISEALAQRGYTAADLDKILGGNLMRVFGEVEKVSKQMQGTTGTRVQGSLSVILSGGVAFEPSRRTATIPSPATPRLAQ